MNVSNFETKSDVYPDSIANFSNSIVSITNAIFDMDPFRLEIE